MSTYKTELRASKIEIHGSETPGLQEILTSSALRFLVGLHQEFNHRRKVLLRYRSMQHTRLSAGKLPEFSDKLGSVGHLPWTVTSTPNDLQDRRGEITGAIDRKSIVRAMNSGANIFVADFEDATSPTWENCVRGQLNLYDTVRGTLQYTKKEGGIHRLKNNLPAIEVRPRGLHRVEKHLLIDGEPISASLFDFGLYFFHNAVNLVQNGSGPYFSLPKLENRREAELWREIFGYAQTKMGHLLHDAIRTSICIETLPAVFQMEEIVYELREYLTSLQAGRWNYLFSLIKNFRRYKRYVLPDRDLVGLGVPFMKAYSRLLVKVAHRRSAHAVGGMTVTVPSREKGWYEQTLNKARKDSTTEAHQGFDGTQVAHPDLVPVVCKAFQNVLGDRLHQKNNLLEDVTISRLDLLHTHLLDTGTITEEAFRYNIDVLILYMASWLKGKGIIEIGTRLENAATAEICRTQMWQWSHQSGVKLEDGRLITKKLCRQLLDEERERISRRFGSRQDDIERFDRASQLFDDLVWSDTFEPYMTLSAYNLLE